MKRLTIIDTFGFFFRNFYALPNLQNKDGFPTGLITGFANFIYSLRNEYETDYIFFALDAKGKNFRHDIDANYKANRPEAPEDLKKQLAVAISWIEKMGFSCFSKEGFEADDVIASAVRFAKRHDISVRIVSHDKDLYQLIDDGMVSIFDPLKKTDIDRQKCLEKFGIYPERIGDYLALVGDSADNIPGVRGIGPKGAKKLLEQFESIEEIYKNLDKVANPRTKKLLEESQENALLSKRLVWLDDSLEIAQRFEKFHFPPGQPLENIINELEKYDMRAVLSKLGKVKKEEKTKKSSFKTILLDSDKKLLECVDGISEHSIVAFDTETTGLDTASAKIVGFSFSLKEDSAYYVPMGHNYLGVADQVSHEAAKKAISKLFTCKLVGQNLKYDLVIVKNNFGDITFSNFADTMVLAWLLAPGLAVGLDALAYRFFKHEMVKFKDVVPKGQNFSAVNIEEASIYAAEDAWMTLKLYHKLTELLEVELLELAKTHEFPFIETLMAMEKEGVKVDISYFLELKKRTETNIEKIKKEVFELCDREFNLNSPKQLGEVLFEHMRLPVVKKTKSSYSTDESVLRQLLGEHKVVEKILEYREIHKLLSTYIKPLLVLGEKSKDARIHTSFLQTGTATGRLSSKDPNLQNIPVKTTLGREVREGFISKEGYSFIGIDYSQIELRLLAHFSKDEALVKAFNNNLDIHKQTALKLFGEEKADEKRAVAKSINFGLLYGMGARKLSQTLDISQKEAKGYIDSYFASFPTVKEYLEGIRQEAKRDSYVSTLLGRRRYFDFESANGMQLPMYEREAVNTLFQGSAADLIKLAMNEIHKKLLGDDAKLLLQIHDELIFEVKDSLLEDFSKKAKEIMINIYPLEVKLDASINIGKSWGELK